MLHLLLAYVSLIEVTAFAAYRCSICNSNLMTDKATIDFTTHINNIFQRPASPNLVPPLAEACHRIPKTFHFSHRQFRCLKQAG